MLLVNDSEFKSQLGSGIGLSDSGELRGDLKSSKINKEERALQHAPIFHFDYCSLINLSGT